MYCDRLAINEENVGCYSALLIQLVGGRSSWGGLAHVQTGGEAEPICAIWGEEAEDVNGPDSGR